MASLYCMDCSGGNYSHLYPYLFTLGNQLAGCTVLVLVAQALSILQLCAGKAVMSRQTLQWYCSKLDTAQKFKLEGSLCNRQSTRRLQGYTAISALTLSDECGMSI